MFIPFAGTVDILYDDDEKETRVTGDLFRWTEDPHKSRSAYKVGDRVEGECHMCGVVKFDVDQIILPLYWYSL